MAVLELVHSSEVYHSPAEVIDGKISECDQPALLLSQCGICHGLHANAWCSLCSCCSYYSSHSSCVKVD